MNAPSYSLAKKDHREFLASCYNRTAALLEKLKLYLEKCEARAPIYSRESVTKRLVQEVRFILDEPLRRIEAQCALRGEKPLLIPSARFKCAGLLVDTSTGVVRPTAGFFAKALTRFLALWAVCAATAIASPFCRQRVERALLVFGVPEEGLFRDGNDSTFAEFSRNGPIVPLKRASKLVVQTTTAAARSTDPRIHYARHPLLALTRLCKLSLCELLGLLVRHTFVGLHYLIACVRFPLLVVLWRDYGFHALAEQLGNDRRVDGVLITNTNLGRQLLCLADLPGKPFSVQLVFYSEHDCPANYIDVGEKFLIAPALPYLRVHDVWAWTPDRAKMIAQLNLLAEVHVVGPILWEIPTQKILQRKSSWISVFDITPLTDVATMTLGLLGNYYSVENMIAFIDGIQEAMRQTHCKLPIVLKPKRPIAALKSETSYIARINSDATIRKLPSSASVFEVVAKSAVVIVYPFTTVAYAAEKLGVPAIYFDPTGQLEGRYQYGRHIRYASGLAALISTLRVLMAEHA